MLSQVIVYLAKETTAGLGDRRGRPSQETGDTSQELYLQYGFCGSRAGLSPSLSLCVCDTVPFHFAQLCDNIARIKSRGKKTNKTKSKQMHCGSLWMKMNVKEAPDVPVL